MSIINRIKNKINHNTLNQYFKLSTWELCIAYACLGLIDRIPHTVDPLVSGVTTTLELVEEMNCKVLSPSIMLAPAESTAL